MTPPGRSGYINFSSVYIGWLCGAVFLHLPSLKSLGLDVRTDVSVLLTLFLLSLLVSMYPCCLCILQPFHSWCSTVSAKPSGFSAVHLVDHSREDQLMPDCVQALVTLHGLHGLAVFCKLLSPALYNPLTGYQDWLSIILLNSFNLAVACRYAVH